MKKGNASLQRERAKAEAAVLGGLALLAYAGVRWWRERRLLAQEVSLLPFPLRRQRS